MAGDCREELVPLEREEPQGLQRSYGCRPGNVAQECDLTEGVAGAELSDRAVLQLHRSLPGGNRIEVVADLAAGDESAVTVVLAASGYPDAPETGVEREPQVPAP